MKRAFTLIELLVVIAIIAILAAILFPVFAQAKKAAKKTVCLTHMKEIGLGLQLYINDSDDTFSPAYYYNIPNVVAGGGDGSGIHQWSGIMQPYVKSFQMFVDPGDPTGGIAPTNFSDIPGAPINLGAGINAGAVSYTTGTGLQDQQAPRLSYTVNEAIMPRPRGFGGNSGQPQNMVSSTAIDSPAGTILIAQFSDYPAAIAGTSTASSGSVTNKSHRPTDGYMLSNSIPSAGSVYNTDNAITSPIYALDAPSAQIVFKAQPTLAVGAGSNYPRIVYANSGSRYDGNGVYVFGDTHAKIKSVISTFDCNAFLWGTKAYSNAGAPVSCFATGAPVTTN